MPAAGLMLGFHSLTAAQVHKRSQLYTFRQFQLSVQRAAVSEGIAQRDPLLRIRQAFDSILLASTCEHRAEAGSENEFSCLFCFAKANQVADDVRGHDGTPAIDFAAEGPMRAPDFATDARPAKPRAFRAGMRYAAVHAAVDAFADVFDGF